MAAARPETPHAFPVLVETANPRRTYYPGRFTLVLFYLFATNTVFPLVDVPLLGLSITAVLFALVTLDIVFRSNYLSLRDHAHWYLLAYAIGFAVFLSLTLNGIAGNLDFGVRSLLSIVQALYWLIVLIVTLELVSHLKTIDVRVLAVVLGIAVIAVGLLRLLEAIAFDRMGPGTSQLLTQNAYGIVFSTYTPFAIILVFLTQRLGLRILAVFGVLLLVVAIAINGSRSSWLASALGAIVLTLLFMLTQHKRVLSVSGLVVVVLIAGSLLIAAAPSEVLDRVSARFATLERVEEDKSYAVRELMQQKALTLFSESPFFGVGRGQFRNNEVEFDFSGTPFSANPTRNFNRVASHNSYAQWIAELGLAGTIPLVILLLLLGFRGARAAVRLGRNGEIWALAAFAGFIAMSLHMWSIDNLQTTSTWFMYGLVAGMIGYERYRHSAARPG